MFIVTLRSRSVGTREMRLWAAMTTGSGKGEYVPTLRLISEREGRRVIDDLWSEKAKREDLAVWACIISASPKRLSPRLSC